MLAGAGLTAFYTFRMTWLVFFGKRRAGGHAHDAGSAMKVSLGLLSAGTFVSWLAAGALNRLFAETLPLHHIEQAALAEILIEIVSAPATALALLVIALGFGLFWWYGRARALAEGPAWYRRLSEASFGLEPVNAAVVRGVRAAAEALRVTQTGALNWNVLGILSALLALLLILGWSA
jgi:NADH-quinone oxidoreductase subunit L